MAICEQQSARLSFRTYVDRQLGRGAAAPWTEYASGGALELRLPRCDLIGMNVELLGKLSQRSITLDGGKRHLRLEGRCVVGGLNPKSDRRWTLRA
jgi:hypothetical protein